jgi:hypothetical protein
VRAVCQDGTCTSLLVSHNTIDSTGVQSDPIAYLGDRNLRQVTVKDNLLAGGTYTMQASWTAGAIWQISGNRFVAGTSAYGPVTSDGTCAHQVWTANSIVEIDASYRITKTDADLACVN